MPECGCGWRDASSPGGCAGRALRAWRPPAVLPGGLEPRAPPLWSGPVFSDRGGGVRGGRWPPARGQGLSGGQGRPAASVLSRTCWPRPHPLELSRCVGCHGSLSRGTLTGRVGQALWPGSEEQAGRGPERGQGGLGLHQEPREGGGSSSCQAGSRPARWVALTKCPLRVATGTRGLSLTAVSKEGRGRRPPGELAGGQGTRDLPSQGRAGLGTAASSHQGTRPCRRPS